jgi:hypothetical protein
MAVWRYVIATSIGTSHIKQGLPCQDYAKCLVTPDKNNAPVLITVVSDGAGSAENSHIGSELACTLFIESAAAYLSENTVAAIDSAMTQAWLQKIRDAIQQRAESDEKRPRDYACTFLAAIIGQDRAAYVQIGDGAIVVSDGEESNWGWVFWPQRGEFANTTFFLTDDNALERVCFDTAEIPPLEVALFTDGIEPLVLEYATQTAFAPFYDKMFPPVRTATAEGLNSDLSLSLEKYLASPSVCDRTDDDKSLILATRRPPNAAPVEGLDASTSE